MFRPLAPCSVACRVGTPPVPDQAAVLGLSDLGFL